MQMQTQIEKKHKQEAKEKVEKVALDANTSQERKSRAEEVSLSKREK